MAPGDAAHGLCMEPDCRGLAGSALGCARGTVDRHLRPVWCHAAGCRLALVWLARPLAAHRGCGRRVDCWHALAWILDSERHGALERNGDSVSRRTAQHWP